RPAMEPANKRDDVLPARLETRQLDACFDRLRAGVTKKRPHAPANRDDVRQLLRQPYLDVVIEIRPGHVEELASLILDGADDVRMRVSRGGHRYTGRAIEKQISVDILDGRSEPALDNQRIAARVARRHHDAITLDERLRARAGQRHSDIGDTQESYLFFQ